MNDVEVQALDTPGPVIEHDRPALETPTNESDGKSELDRHKEARGYTKPAEPVSDGPPPLEAPEPEPAAKPEKEAAWTDPDTGDRYDMRHKVARRIKKVLEERAKANEELTRIRQERDELLRSRAMPEPAPRQMPAAETEPDPSNLEKYPEGQYDRGFIRDQAKWTATEVTRQAMREAREQSDMGARQRADAQIVKQWQDTSYVEAKQKYANFDEVLGQFPNTPENLPLVRLMMGSPVGNDVVYVLGTQPEARAAYDRATPDQKLRLLYHLEARLLSSRQATTSPTSTTTRAPQPITPVHAGAGPQGPIDWSRTDDPDQYARYKSMRNAKR